MDDDTFTRSPDGAVLISGPVFEGGIPLVARLEDGRWRIGCRRGRGFDFDIFIDYPNPVLHM
jgi:hypothetical protein